MADNETPPIVAPTPAYEQATSAVRSVLLVVGAVTGLAGIIGRRDLAGFIVYVQSSEFITAVGLMITAATFAYSQWKTRHRAKQLVAIRDDERVPAEVVK